MKKYEIINKVDWKEFVLKFENYFELAEKNNQPFQKLNILVKKWRKDKTPEQHRYYWVVINEMRKGFINVGHDDFTPEMIHELIKKEHGFTTQKILPDGKIISTTKSISDISEDINIKVMTDLIDFAIRWSAIHLDWSIQDPRG